MANKKSSNTKKPTHTGIVVLESRWWNKSNISVRGMFELVSEIYCENPNAFHYEMANSEAAMKEAISRTGEMKHTRYLSIAAHGTKGKIQLFNGEDLSRTELANALNKSDRFKFTGLHLGSCLIGSDELAQWLFDNNTKLKWVAGYSNEVDWIESSALDLLFFNEMLRRHRNAPTPSSHLLQVAERVRSLAGGLADKLGFGIFVPKQKTGGSKNILRQPELDD